MGKTITYAYDVGGNITAKTEYAYTTGIPVSVIKTYNYAYDSTWKDKLISYDGKTITYDAIGNPLTYDGWTFTWDGGRQLAGLSRTGQTITYKYNDAGIRTEKTVNGITTKYHLLGDKVTYETNNSQPGNGIYYTYDPSGKLISMSLSDTPDLFGEDGWISAFESGSMTGDASIAYAWIQVKGYREKALRLVSEPEIPGYWDDEFEVFVDPVISIPPVARSTALNLERNKKYVLEFDYWADVDNLPFKVDLYPDDLPETSITANTQVQHYRWEFEPSSYNMQNAAVRFFNDTEEEVTRTIIITNIKLYKLEDTTDTYYYIRNGQGDIIGLIDSNGTQVVSYTYDTWSRLLSISGPLASSVGFMNLHRYIPIQVHTNDNTRDTGTTKRPGRITCKAGTITLRGVGLLMHMLCLVKQGICWGIICLLIVK